MKSSLDLVFLGLSITSSWGNGHATTYRSLLKPLAARGHRITFLERDVPYYAAHRDLSEPQYAKVHLYRSTEELHEVHGQALRSADLVVVGSHVPEGKKVGALVQALAPGHTAFYDIDTPITLADLARGQCTYLSPALVAGYSLYLSFSGGPTLEVIEREWGSPCARVLHCSADPETYFSAPTAPRWDMGYLGTYSADRQAALARLLVDPARFWPDGRFVVAGAQYPQEIDWPENVTRIAHLHPGEHRAFYNAQRFTLNVTRDAMVRAGWSPSVRIFEAAACGTAVVTDRWPGIQAFFAPGKEILVADSTAHALEMVRSMPDRERVAIGRAAQRRFLAEHTAMHRAETLERYACELLDRGVKRSRAAVAGPTRVGGGGHDP